MKTLHTISGKEIKVSANQSKRTFTIRTNGSKYRTLPMHREEFKSADINWTGDDWQQFLKSDEYYIVK